MRPAPPVVLPLRRSRVLSVMVSAIHLLAAVAVLQADLHPLFAAVLLGAIVISIYRIRGVSACSALVLHSDGCFEKVGAGDTALVPHPGTSRIGSLAVLCFPVAGRMQALVLMPDSFSTVDDWRCFCRWLRWRVAKAA